MQLGSDPQSNEDLAQTNKQTNKIYYIYTYVYIYIHIKNPDLTPRKILKIKEKTACRLDFAHKPQFAGPCSRYNPRDQDGSCHLFKGLACEVTHCLFHCILLVTYGLISLWEGNYTRVWRLLKARIIWGHPEGWPTKMSEDGTSQAI